jgi:Ricin-type beta-trefoil lectin domain
MMRTRPIIRMLLPLAVAAATTLTAGQAFARSYPGPHTSANSHRAGANGDAVYILTDEQTGFCLDSDYIGKVYADGCNGGEYQLWAHATPANTYYVMRDDQTGLCLVAAPLSSPGATSKVTAATCNYNDVYQDWGWGFITYDFYKVINEGTGEDLDSNTSGAVYVDPNHGTGDLYQDWAINQSGTAGAPRQR